MTGHSRLPLSRVEGSLIARCTSQCKAAKNFLRLYGDTGTIGILGGFAAAAFDFRYGALIFLTDRGFKLLA